jgi:uncharacterized protein (DUF2236 family)
VAQAQDPGNPETRETVRRLEPVSLSAPKIAAAGGRPGRLPPLVQDEGYFPNGAVLRRVMSERRVGLLAGQRALMIGATNPLNFIGATRDARGRREPFNRLKDTGIAWETAFYEPRAVVDAMLADVARRHRRMHGVLLEDAGPYAAGTAWAADMPELKLWTIAVLMDSVETLHELLIGPLGDDGREGLWTLGLRRVALLFGVPDHVLPATHGEFRRAFDLEIASDRLFLTDEARYFGRAIGFQIPMARPAELTIRYVHNLLLAGSLPARIRALYRVRWTAVRQAAFLAIGRAIRAAAPLAPARLTKGRCAACFEAVARTEHHRLRNGRPTPHLPPLSKHSALRTHAVASLARDDSLPLVGQQGSNSANQAHSITSGFGYCVGSLSQPP